MFLKKNIFLSALVGLFSIAAHGDTITLYNTTSSNLYAAVYYLPSSGDATLASPVYFAASYAPTILERPARKSEGLFSYVDRMLMFSPKKENFTETIPANDFKKMDYINVGTLQGSSFYIAWQKIKGMNRLKGFTYFGWYVHQITHAQEYITQHNLMFQKGGKGKGGAHATAYVETEGGLDSAEATYTQKRLAHTKQSIERLTGIHSSYAPKIAFVCSGGGYRAMLSTLGSLHGAERSGLLDTCLWATCLSGSAWAINPWINSGLSLTDYTNQLFDKIATDITTLSSQEAQLLNLHFLAKNQRLQPMTLVDLYGGLLANRLLSEYGKQRHIIKLSDLQDKLDPTRHPLPINTAVQMGKESPIPRWYEFTPYHIASLSPNLSIPTWACGRKFNQGHSVDFYPEQSLGFLLGTFGSAFAIPFGDLFFILTKSTSEQKNIVILSALFIQMKKTIAEASFMQKRIKYSWGEIFNFAYGMAEDPTKKPIIKLVDAALDFNLPYPPISGQREIRKADIIVLLDYSENAAELTELRKLDNYAQKNNLTLPTLSYENTGNRAISVFKDEGNITTPVVIYLPLIRDQQLWTSNKDNPNFAQYKEVLASFNPSACAQFGPCKTRVFKYSRNTAQALYDHSAFVMEAVTPTIIDAIAWKQQQYPLRN